MEIEAVMELWAKVFQLNLGYTSGCLETAGSKLILGLAGKYCTMRLRIGLLS